MGEQSAARLKGDDYQHLYSWFELLSLLNPTSQYEYGYVEHPCAGAADDVTLHAKHPGLATKFTQLKFHVDQKSQYSSSMLIEAQKPGSRSLLEKLFDSWRNLRNGGNQNVEIWLVSNWAYSEDIGRFVSDAGSLTESFYTGGTNSKSGKIRSQWGKALSATPEELEGFCRDLRLRLGFGGLNEVEDRVDERMERYNLRAGQLARAIILDVVRGWIKQGGTAKRIDKSILENVVLERGLKRTPVEQPQVSLFVHGWARRGYDVPPTIELDWTRYFDFDARAVPSDQIWERTLFPELKAAREQLSEMPKGAYIDFRAKLPLTASLAVGRIFSEAMGFRFRVEQPSSGEILLWRSDEVPQTFPLRLTETPLVPDGKAGLLSLSITGDSKPDVSRIIGSLGGNFKLWVDVTPAAGPSGTALRAGSEAVSVAEQVKSILRSLPQQHGVETLHLVLYCPATVALFLGQRMNALGEVLTYERTVAGSYQRSVTLQTG